MHQWRWGENGTRQRNEGGFTGIWDGHWKDHKFQYFNGETQISGSWARRSPAPPPPPSTPPLAAKRCRHWMALLRPFHVALQLCISSFHDIFALTSPLASLLVETICLLSDQLFASLSNSFPKTHISSFRCSSKYLSCPPE